MHYNEKQRNSPFKFINQRKGVKSTISEFIYNNSTDETACVRRSLGQSCQLLVPASCSRPLGFRLRQGPLGYTFASTLGIRLTAGEAKQTDKLRLVNIEYYRQTQRWHME